MLDTNVGPCLSSAKHNFDKFMQCHNMYLQPEFHQFLFFCQDLVDDWTVATLHEIYSL